ncbi:MAG: site-specific DNA-methyltransferase [Thaumarchaeota archaeon]|nr:site-specific DNA-methyltransferase [Nitrososphaerota archaeon]
MDKLPEIPDESIDCIISSPPYWGLRDYGVEGQLGLEPDFRDYLKIMGKIMDQLKRVLKSTGSCWINLGDTYAGGKAHSDWNGCTAEFIGRTKETEQYFVAQSKNHLQAKSRYGIPERFYIQCIDSGWIARNHIPWYKSNSMPSSVKDRFTNK